MKCEEKGKFPDIVCPNHIGNYNTHNAIIKKPFFITALDKSSQKLENALKSMHNHRTRNNL